MARDNFLFQLDNKNYQTKRRSANVHFDDKLENLSVVDWQNKKCKYRHATLAEEDCNNTVA